VQHYRSGRDLGDWLKEIPSPPTQFELDSLFGPLLNQVELIHRRGLLHCEITPSNIFICDDGSPVLLDLMIMEHDDVQRTKKFSVIVKAGYSAPELYSLGGKGRGPWSDIYSLAATLYHAIGGATPEAGADRVPVDNLAPIRDVVRIQYRASFLEAIDWALRPRPKDRPQTVGEWRRRLLG
jgi:serine/threonine protein kinase